MTLIQKLNDSIITNINIVESENKMCYDYNHLELAENCEVIAEDFAIGFAEWCQYRCVQKEDLKNQLEIYKEEKGL